jgi:essential nuclear protein 1
LREAIVIGSVLSKVSIPVLQSAAAIYRIAEMEYSPTNSIFLKYTFFSFLKTFLTYFIFIFVRILLNKKYNLPIRVIDTVCDHFQQFMQDERRMIVSWHQSLLVFVQRYKNDLTTEQKQMIRTLIRVHSHHQITPNIRYELDNSIARGGSNSLIFLVILFLGMPTGIGNIPLSMVVE